MTIHKGTTTEKTRPNQLVAPAARRDPVMAWTGLGAAIVTFSVLFVPHAGLPDAPTTQEVTDFFTTHYRMQQAQPLMHAVGAALTLVFLVRLAAHLRAMGKESSGDLVRAAGAAITAVAVLTMGWVAAVVTLTGELDGELQYHLYTLGWDFHFRLVYLLPLVLLPVGWALREGGSKVLGWVTLLLGSLTALAPLGYLGESTWVVQYPAFMLFVIWVAVCGGVLGLRRSSST